MIDGNKSDGFVLTCDICQSEVKYFESFDEAKEHKDTSGWKSKFLKNQWNDVCYQCLSNGKF